MKYNNYIGHIAVVCWMLLFVSSCSGEWSESSIGNLNPGDVQAEILYVHAAAVFRFSHRNNNMQRPYHVGNRAMSSDKLRHIVRLKASIESTFCKLSRLFQTFISVSCTMSSALSLIHIFMLTIA